MKTLHLLRHAKSSWDEPDLRDIDRPLSKRGRKACRQMAPVLAAMQLDLASAWCSPALRTCQTLKGLLASGLFAEGTPRVDAALYTFSAATLMDWVRAADDGDDEIIMLGHNPALTDLCNTLGDTQLLNIPTCAYVRLQLDISQWRQVHTHCGRLRAFVAPSR